MEQTKYDVFISYSRKDSSTADAICKAMESVGLTYFIDKQGIGGGKEFPSVLADAICDSEIFLFLASENSYESKFTNSEITFAFNEKPHERIIPYIIDKSKLPRHLRFVFSSITWRNLQEHPIESVLIPDILKLLGKERIITNSITSGEALSGEVLCTYEGDADYDFDSAYTAWLNKEYSKAFPFFLRLAQCGYEQAYGYVGLCYELGEGVTKDYQQMLVYYNKAIEAKMYLGVYRLGMYYTSKGDYYRARQLYEQAIREGWATGDAYIKIATMYEKGQGGKIDLDKAIESYRIALQHGERDAQTSLHRLGVFDVVVLPNEVLNNSAEQLYRLGEKNSKGYHNDNTSLAFAYFKAAAEKGHPFAAKKVVELYEKDGFPMEERYVRDYRALATNEMIVWVRNDYNFAWEAGYAYHYGVGCCVDIEKAEECHTIGANHSNASCLWDLGRIEEMRGNYSDAYKNYKLAAESGQGMAMFELARCYEMGIGTTKNIAMAIQWYEACSQSHYASAYDAKRKLRELS